MSYILFLLSAEASASCGKVSWFERSARARRVRELGPSQGPNNTHLEHEREAGFDHALTNISQNHDSLNSNCSWPCTYQSVLIWYEGHPSFGGFLTLPHLVPQRMPESLLGGFKLSFHVANLLRQIISHAVMARFW